MILNKLNLQLFAHKKGQGSSTNGRDSNPQYLGLKRTDGCVVTAGTIIVRQCGTKFHAGEGVGCGKDYTLYALKDGVVKFITKGCRKFVTIVERSVA